ncbi:branched-chain amino acid ABC transporter permease [Streptomyces tirandamycinicus]|uniref:Branched-chain amino acid ABC transporter permease n=1 Tax=Streptomyces tirandamycinicus TaxID=2174846 RepID=A0A2S1SZE6_9ACTN|nr:MULTISPECIES: branched-chain amino acid ABC transporter permease [Streptomyces]AWI31778.1 branched-chain amino acid ABC transporter permease [Streptomyces tirandamycinicus]MCY0984369.1 branched-chain amino acid ABC transporter permease [Streptomyces tirandamycinicus]NNJ04798.1 branched-chain amino acid ABC transporter permease [Streptomyces sp. PKU-MA01144]TFE52901.1 branched-chain amino acid ABC transporter permease [Streptomyces sp. ICN441]
MIKFAETVLNGFALGSVYALIALGFVVIFKASGVMNFAHGSLLLFGGYVTARLHDAIGFIPAVLVGAALAAALAGLVQLLATRGLRGAEIHTLTILTIGVDVLLSTELNRQIGADYLTMGDPWGADVTRLGSITVADARVASIVVAVVVIGAFFAAFRWSRWGLSMRSAAADPEAAALMGIRLDRVRLIAWCVAGALAAVAAVFLAAFPAPGLDRTTGQIALSAFPAAILGGMDSAVGALVGSLVIGLTAAMAAGYQNELSVLGAGFPDVAPYLVMVLVLLVRPTGLFGSKELTRV